MEEKKPSTADILAKIRAQKAAAAAAHVETPVPLAETPPAEQVAATAATSPAVTDPVVATKPVNAGSKPSSTKDIMAAIRAGGAKPSGAAGSVPVATPAPAASPAIVPTAIVPTAIVPTANVPTANVPTATVPKPPAAVVAAGPKLSPQEMLQKMREAKAAAGSAAAPVATVAKVAVPVAAPPMPAKPVAAGKGAKPSTTQRGLAGLTTVATFSGLFLLLGYLTDSSLLYGLGLLAWAALLTPFAAAWTAIASIGGIWTLGTARFMFPNVLVEPPSKFKVGPLSDYPLNTVSNKWKDQFGIWIVHTDQYEGRNMIFALASVCTHLGCTPNWLDGEQKFKCPCHGSGFYMTGINFEGPAPRPLERMGLRISGDGMLEVNKSVKYQEEMGQWADATSYVEVV